MNYPRNGECLLILDPSGEHLGWTIMKLKSGTATITNCGMLYASSSWELGRRLHYLYKCLKFLIQHFKVNHIVTEDFVIPKFRQSGITVIPTIINNLKMLCWELAPKGELGLTEVSVPTWRRHLSISAIPLLDKKGKIVLNKKNKPVQDWKTPCATKVQEILKLKLPKEILANTSLSLRATPSDIGDVLGIAVGQAIELHYPKIVANSDLFDHPDTIYVIKMMYTMK